MNKEQLIALGLTEEQAEKVLSANTEQLKGFIPKSRFDEVNNAKKNLETQLTERDNQLKELKKNNKDNEELQSTIKRLEDENKSAKENAKKYYDKYAKLSRTTKALSEEILKTKNDIEHLQSIQTALEVSSDDESLSQIRQELVDFGYIKKHSSAKKQKIASHPYHYISSDGYDIYVGKNNYQNEELTFKVATGNDWWFHAKGIPGSHVILKSNNEEELPDRAYEEAAALAAFYSKAKDADKVEVDYIQKKNIKKVAGAAPGFVIYHSNWSMVATPKANLQQK